MRRFRCPLSQALVLMDNNILACEYGIAQLESLIGSGYAIDLNQGMDARLQPLFFMPGQVFGSAFFQVAPPIYKPLRACRSQSERILRTDYTAERRNPGKPGRLRPTA